jgi:hypothetical protein
MIITIGICLIATLLVLANYKFLRNPKILVPAFLITAGLLAVGLSLLIKAPGDKTIYAVFLSPFIALLLLQLVRFIYRRKLHQEIIMHMYGIYPIRSEDRFVTRLEKTVTFLVTGLSVAIPILLIELI